MYDLERKIIDNMPHIKFWRRYINDILCIIDVDSERTIIDLLTKANSINVSIQFTCESDINGIAFLDTWLQIIDNQL